MTRAPASEESMLILGKLESMLFRASQIGQRIRAAP
jgi:hypothetical protein